MSEDRSPHVSSRLVGVLVAVLAGAGGAGGFVGSQAQFDALTKTVDAMASKVDGISSRLGESSTNAAVFGVRLGQIEARLEICERDLREIQQQRRSAR